jgi:hypothetical protein
MEKFTTQCKRKREDEEAEHCHLEYKESKDLQKLEETTCGGAVLMNSRESFGCRVSTAGGKERLC